MRSAIAEDSTSEIFAKLLKFSHVLRVSHVAESQSMVRTIGVRKQQKCFRGSDSKYCCLIYKTTTGSRSEANRCKQREGMRRVCAAAKQRQSSRRAFLELWQQSSSILRAFRVAKQNQRSRRALCQNCTFGALQAWSLHFLFCDSSY